MLDLFICPFFIRWIIRPDSWLFSSFFTFLMTLLFFQNDYEEGKFIQERPLEFFQCDILYALLSKKWRYCLQKEGPAGFFIIYTA